MALVVHPEGTQVSGSIGGTVWSHNRFGAYKRNRTVPVNPNTDRQAATRNVMRSLTIGWETYLTQAERDAWKVYADNVPWLNRLGQSVLLTGMNMFVRTNVARQLAGPAYLATAPAIFDLAPAELVLGISASEATQELTVVFDDTLPWVDETGAFESIAMGLPQNPGIQFFGGPWRLGAPILGSPGAPETAPYTLDAPYPFTEGQRIWVQTRIGLADGRLSDFARVNFLAEA
jgi:hypothetical protein